MSEQEQALRDGLDIVRQLLENQRHCERSLCAGCEDARANVLIMVNELLERTKTP